MNQDVLETSRYPEILFESTKGVGKPQPGEDQFVVNLVGTSYAARRH